MMDEVIELLERLANLEPKETAAFKIRISLRNKLAAVHGLNLANEIVSVMDIDVSWDLTDEDIEKIVEPFSRATLNMISAMDDEGFSSAQIINMCRGLSLRMS